MFATTKMSSKGQIVIPEAIRESLQLDAGSEFMIISQEDTLILKKITPPPREVLKKMLDRANAKAKKAGMTKDDIAKAIAGHRKQKS